jgi:cytochrome c oxidase subunit 2
LPLAAWRSCYYKRAPGRKRQIHQEIVIVGNKGWAILFGVVMLACFIGFAISPLPSVGWWMPDGISSHAADVDFLFQVILWITAFFFVLTEGLLVLFMWQYGSQEGKRPVTTTAEVPGVLKPLTNLLHDQHHIELAWTLVPAAILLYIAFAQVNTWANIKYESRKAHTEGKDASLQVAVSARQFEWRMRYPSKDRFQSWLKDKAANKADMDTFGKFPQADDVYVVNELHLWENHQVVVHLTTRDVIHSFNLPNFRVKQDALPGKLIPVWFRTYDTADPKNPRPPVYNCKYDEKKGRFVDGINPKTGEEDHNFIYDIPCAELCGWGHYRMIGRVFVHKDQTSFMHWLELADQNTHRRKLDRDPKTGELISTIDR